MKFIILLLFLAFAMLSGCLHPVPVRHPPAQVKDGNGQLQRTTPAALRVKRAGLLPATTFGELKDNAQVYAIQYGHVAMSIRATEYRFADAKFIGALAGLAGGIAEEVDWAIGGAILAGGSDVVQQHYNLSVQQKNYERASDAFYCIDDLLYAYPRSTVSTPTLNRLNSAITNLRQKLEKAQTQIDLATPDLTLLKKQIEDSIKATKEAESTNDKVANQSASNLSAFLATGLTAAEIKTLETELVSKVEECVASF